MCICTLACFSICNSDHTHIRLIIYLLQSTTGGHGALKHVTLRSEHICPARHPPLSMRHDGSQYGVPVGSSTLHCDPVGQLKSAQAVRLKQHHSIMLPFLQ